MFTYSAKQHKEVALCPNKAVGASEKMAPSFSFREKDSGNAITSGVKGSTHDELAFAPDTESCYIGSTHVPMDCTYADDKYLTIGVIGQKVPAQSGTMRWQDGRITILPTIMKKGVNICEYGDVEVVKFFASFPESTPSSKYVLHLSSADMERDDIVETIEYYVAADADKRKIQPSETASLAEEICQSVVTFLGIKNLGSISTTLFRDRQDVAGDPIDRDLLQRHLERFRVLKD
ncbi:hypothetical protein BDR06DRAFT_977245 [Suillus hirtellus]|nr:hypothetical protein BDR06DRAFT_977245 [Suillus hirtellus]